MTFIFPRGYLSGLTLSAAGGSASFGVAAGQASDTTNAAIINFAAAVTKTTAAWAAGSGNGSLDTGSIAANTWYHVHLIASADGTLTDIMTSLSPSAPSAPAIPAGYSLSRRIGSMRTDESSQWLAFTQFGDLFVWKNQVAELSTSPQPSGNTTVTLKGTPVGVNVLATLQLFVNGMAASQSAAILSPYTLSTSAGFFIISNASNQGAGAIEVMPDTAPSVVLVLGASATVTIMTISYKDTRGKDS